MWYVANLASILVISKASKPTIGSVEEAIAAKYTICVTDALIKRFGKMYPAAMWKGVPYGEEIRNLHAGNCEAFVQSTLFHRRLHSNYYHTLDCQQETDDGLSASESQCVRTASGLILNRDCQIQMVGALLTSLPLAMPVGDRLAHALNQRLLELLDNGVMKQTLNDWFARIKSKCPTDAHVESQTASLPLSSMIGTLILCGVAMLIGLFISLFSFKSGWCKRKTDKAIHKEKNQGGPQQLKDLLYSLQVAINAANTGLEGMDQSNHTSSIGMTQNWTSKNTFAECCKSESTDQLQGAVRDSEQGL